MRDPAYTTAVDAMLDMIRANDLPVPASTRWDVYPRPHLEVLVQPRDFRVWSDAVETVHVSAENTQTSRHMHIYGWIDPERRSRILLTTIAPLAEEASA